MNVINSDDTMRHVPMVLDTPIIGENFVGLHVSSNPEFTERSEDVCVDLLYEFWFFGH